MKRKIKIRSDIFLSLKLKHVLIFGGLSILLLVTSIFLYLNFSTAHKALSATYDTTTSGGDWSTNSTWSGGSAPSNWGSHLANIYGNISVPSGIQGFATINLYSNKSFTSGSSSSAQSLTMQNISNFNVVDGNVTIYGNYTLDNSTMTISSGSLTVTGTLTLTNGATLTSNSSGAINVAAYTTSGGGGTLNINSGTFTVTNSLAINSSSTVNFAVGVTSSVASLSVGDNSNAILNNRGTLTINGNISESGVINNYGTLNVGGNITSNGSGNSIMTNNGNINITGDVTFPSSGKMYINPGGQTIVNGSVTVSSNENLIVGTSAASPPYANMIIKQNLISSSSGDVKINKNGRLIVFGNVTDSGGGGTIFTINDGGQVYVDGNISYSGGGSAILNSNTTSPFGFYVGGTMQNTGGGSTTTTNVGNKNTMYTTNLSFYNFVESFSNLLPVTILSFEAKNNDKINTLKWVTTSQLNFKKFIIERSSDSKIFEKIGEVPAEENTSSKRAYQFNDFESLKGTTYYRLNMTDIDGSYEYSEIVVAQRINSGKDVRIFPNPVINHNFTIEMENIGNTQTNISVRKPDGNEILTQSINGNLSVINLPKTTEKGLYFVTISSGLSTYTKKIIVE